MTPKESEARYRRMKIAAGILLVAAAIFVGWYYIDPLSYNAQRAFDRLNASRPTVDRIAIVPATTPDTVKTTQIVNTDTNRVALIETTEVKSDLVDVITGLKKQAADAKEIADKAIAEAQAQATKTAAAVKESDTLKTMVATLQTSIEKQTAQGKEYLELFKKSQVSAPTNARTTSTKPQASRDTGNKLAYEDEERQSGGDVVGNGKVKFDRTGIPSNWEIRGGDFSKAEKCHGTVYVARKERLPNGGVRNFLGCR